MTIRSNPRYKDSGIKAVHPPSPFHSLTKVKRAPSVFAAALARGSLIGLALLCAALPIELSGQYLPDASLAAPESVTVVPGRRYQTGWFFSTAVIVKAMISGFM